MQVATLVHTLNNTSVVVKASITALIFFYLIGLIPGAYPALSITPSLLLPPNFRIWTLVTGLVVERSIVNLIINVPVLIYCGFHLEPLWGALELLKFITITGIGASLTTSLVSLFVYAVTHNSSLWFVQFSGIAGVIGGISVAFKQIIPDQKIDLKFQVLRVHDVPLLCTLIYIFLSVIRLLSYTQPTMILCGIGVGWIYLRYYQPHGKGIRGDMAESFEAASLFPPILRPPVRVLSTALFKVLVSFGVCKNPVRTYDVGAPSSITISLPGTDPADAERRRKKALRALNERLVQMQQKSQPDEEEENWPTIEDELQKSAKKNEEKTEQSITSVDSESTVENEIN